MSSVMCSTNPVPSTSDSSSPVSLVFKSVSEMSEKSGRKLV